MMNNKVTKHGNINNGGDTNKSKSSNDSYNYIIKV